nr:MAG: internal scaffolding protein [Microvirus sp.]
MKFQHAYSEPFRGSDLECKDPSLTQQSFKDDADINVMLEKFKVTGVLPQGVIMPTYGDFSGVNDYRTAREAMLKAEHAFMDMPANVRARFDNDPQAFLEFCADDKNREEAIRLGLVPKPPVEPVKAPEPAKPAE